MKFLKSNFLSLLILAVLVVGLVRSDSSFGVSETTTFTNPINFDQTVSLDGDITVVDDLTVGGDATIDGLTSGNVCFATSTTGVLTEAQLLAYGCIEVDPTFPQAVLALTLPATSTMTTLIPLAGQCRDWFIDNSDVAAATTTTIVKGAGWDLVGLDATGAGTGADVIDGLEYGTLRACRQTDTDVIGYLQEYIHAD